MFRRLFFILCLVISLQCGGTVAPVPSSLLVGNCVSSGARSPIMEMKFVDDGGGRVTGTACGVTSSYLTFVNAPVTLTGRQVEFVVTERSVIDAIGCVNPTVGMRYSGQLEGTTISGQIIGRGGPAVNIGFVRVDNGSGTCDWAARYNCAP